MVTSGEAGIDGLHPDECRALRETEEINSARIVGVDSVEFLGFPDGTVMYGLALRAAVAQVVRFSHRPEIVITGNFRDSFGPGSLNQADHIATGQAVLDGVRDAGNRWIFPEQLTDGLEPWGGVRAVWAAGSPESGTPPTRPTRSTSVSPRSRRTTPTSRGWAGRAGVRASSSRAT